MSGVMDHGVVRYCILSRKFELKTSVCLITALEEAKKYAHQTSTDGILQSPSMLKSDLAKIRGDPNLNEK